jgi:hypothetical protein
MRLKLMLSAKQLYELYHAPSTPAKQVAERLGIRREYLYRILKKYEILTKSKLRNETINIPESPRDLNDFCNVGIYDGDGYNGDGLLKVCEKQFWKPSKIRGIRDVVSVVFSSRYAFERLKTLRENARMQITDIHKAAAYLQGAFAAEGDIYVDKRIDV